MTTPAERTRSILKTRDFLRELSLDVALPESVRYQAKALLRHFPEEHNLESIIRLEDACWGLLEDPQKQNLIMGVHCPVFSDGSGSWR